MDWQAFSLSLQLAAWTTIVLIPISVIIARMIAWRRFAAKGFIEALVALPLVLPPTVLGYYLLTVFSKHSTLGGAYQSLFNQSLAFSFEGLLLASLIINIPFAVQPMQRAFEAMPGELREAAWCSGLSRWQTFLRIEFPLAWTGILTAAMLTFAHTLGEFGVVLMVGGNIPGETQTIAIAIYDRVQAFDDQQAASMSALLLMFSFVAIGVIYFVNDRFKQRFH
ncbi:molybdate ABC transporter permease subunit [Gammaproteobacteria bacterium]|jgi:molybdate transport system permease protein|nr:molybdate ABC transporter permease subunit [Gammaproteobacteria bacterium]